MFRPLSLTLLGGTPTLQSVADSVAWPILTVTLRVSSRDSRVALPVSDSQGQ